MKTFLLIRHALTDAVNSHTLSGRMSGMHLNENGKAQAENLSEKLVGLPIGAIYSSPLERAVETAEPIAKALDLEIQISDSFGELDLGDWTGRNYDELHTESKWRNFNVFRSSSRIPNGEMMLEAQTRIVSEMQNLYENLPDETAIIVSHSDIIKAAIAHYAGISLDLFHRIEISPASISIVAVGEDTAKILCINNTEEIVF